MRTKQGIVVSDKMQNTIVVSVEMKSAHKKYHKQVASHKKFKADTNSMTVQEGDQVIIEECRPISKDKCWKVIEVIAQK